MLNDNDESFGTDDRQKDVAEFLFKLMMFVHENYTIQNFEESPIERNFGIQVQKVAVCSICEKVVTDYDFHKGVISYTGSLGNHEKTELNQILENCMVEEIQHLYCNVCNDRTNHQVNFRWVSPPPCLVIVIKRYFYNWNERRVEKSPTLVSITDSLNM